MLEVEALPGVLGIRGKGIYLRVMGNKGHILRGSGKLENIGEHETLESQFSVLREQRNKPIYSIFYANFDQNGSRFMSIFNN